MGGSLATLVWSVVLANLAQKFSFLKCPQSRLVFKPYVWSELNCENLDGLFDKKIEIYNFFKVKKPHWKWVEKMY